MVEVQVRSLRAHSSSSKGYEASLEIDYKGNVYTIKVSNLCRLPGSAEASIEDGKLVIRLRDSEGEGFATCIVDQGHLERGCLDCRCLLAPPSSQC